MKLSFIKGYLLVLLFVNLFRDLPTRYAEIKDLMKTFIFSLYLFLSFSFFAITGTFPVDITTNHSNNFSKNSTIGFCPDSNGTDTDGDGSEDLCDLDDDNDGIPDLIECPIIPINFNNFSGGTHLAGESDAILNTYITGENLPQPISISAPVPFGGTNDFSLTAENGGEILRLQDEDHFQAISGFTTTLEIQRPASFRFSTNFISSELNYTDALEITPINPTADFAWNIIQENNADINISATDVLEIIGTGNSNFAEFDIQTLGFSEGFTIKFTNLVSSDPTAVSPSNMIQFSVSTCPDTDFDGVVNKLDLDSDNDGILDLDEAGHGAEDDDHDGRIDGLDYEFDDNGLFDDLETSPESGILNYTIGDSESTPDGIFDAYEIDADGDTCFDALEEDISDPDNDGTAGTGVPTVDVNGLITSITYANPLKHYWRNSLMGPCLMEICNDGIDNDADDLIDCMDCQDCLDATNCADQDQDGVNNYCDLDDDNDGIKDNTEGRCANSIRFVGWSHNKDDPIGQPKGHFKAGFDPQFVTSAEDETNGPGTTISLIYSNSIVGGVASESLNESIINEDYLPYSFITATGWPENIEINSISHYNALELQNQDASYEFSILWSTDGFATNEILVENIHVRPIDIHILDVIQVPPMDLQPSTNYEFRVYFYNLKGHTEFGWDDFSLSGCQHTDTDNDGISDFYDLDSDADGCVDAIEGSGTISLLDILNDTISGGVQTNGIPNSAGPTGQGIGTAQNPFDLSNYCSPCFTFYHTAVACDDNEPCTAADSMMVSLVDGSTCTACVGTEPVSCDTGPTTVEPCDDGNILTIDDEQTVRDCDGFICEPCQGTPIDCTNSTTSIVTCDDNNPCTENDKKTILDADGSDCIPCAGSPLDCNSGTTSIVACDDGNIFTINDQQTILDCDNSICVPCLGTPVDCSNGTTSIVSCNDNDPCTENDVQSVLDSDGTICIPCAGTQLDCSNGSTSIVPCDDGNIFTINDQQTILDCDNSICVPCLGTPVDCSNGTTSIVSCNDNDPCTENDLQSVLNSDGTICIPCAGTPLDCSNGSTSIVSCDDGNIFTINDQQTILDCDSSICVSCLGIPVDCSNGTTSIVSCNDNDPCTENDVQSILDSDGTICIPCAGTPLDCNSGTTSIVPCDDGNIFTINDQQTILDCDNSICIPCLGTPVDCSNGTTSIVSCNDNDPCTENDVQSVLDSDGSICIPCAGTQLDCSNGAISIVPCDDGNIFTINDQQTILDCDNSICVPCLGTPVDCSNGTTSIVPCNDNDPCTENDVQSILDSDGTICIPCAGTPLDCNSGTTSIVPCDDGNIFTINDQQTILNCNNSICVPCLGIPVNCSNGTTSVTDCDDRNPCTINDQKTILDSDGTVCVPCRGTAIDCSTGPTSIVDCDDGDPCTNNDQMTILDCDSSVCIPCLGTTIEMADPQVEDILICQNELIPTVEVLNPNAEANFEWYNTEPTVGDTPVFMSIEPSFQPILDNSMVDSYSFWVVQKVEDCESEPIPFTITIMATPMVDAGMDIEFDCDLGEVRLNGNVPLDEFDVLWNGPDTNMQVEVINPIVQYPGIYTMQIFDPESGCQMIDTVEVLLPNEINANDDHRELFEGEIYQIDVLENDSLENYDQFFVRTFDLTSGNIFVNNENIVYYTPEELGTKRTESFMYEVCSVECPEVCSEALVTFDISPKGIYISNAFSPNGDGHNDFFFVSGDPGTITEIKKFAVFNRWGAQVFGANNIPINDPQLGWNGFFKGEKVSQNVYIYFVEVEFTDGSLVIFSGDVSVFKN